MAPKQRIYTGRIKRTQDDTAAEKRRRAQPEAAPRTERREKAVKPVKPEKTEKTEKKKNAAKADKWEKAEKIIRPAREQKAVKAEKAGKPPRGEKKEAPVKRRASKEKTPASRRESREREKALLAARERKRALDRTGGAAVLGITFFTIVFDLMGLVLCAVRSGGMDTQALTLMLIMAPMAAFTSLLLPRMAGVDPLLMALTNFLCGVSVVILYTVAPERGARQAAFYAAGVVVMLIISAAVRRLRRWRGLTAAAMVLGIVALALPLAFGEWNYGAKNWVSLPVIGSLQPSEFVKLSLVLTLAYFFGTHRTVLQMMPALLFAAACLVLLMMQRDLGTALIYYITTLVLFYAACGNVPLTLIGLGGGVGAAMLGYRMFAHVKVRVAMWRNPWSDALDKGYQIIQALLAIGSGGLFGVGLGQGTPNKIPAYFNDFIFAVVCEQLGMVFGVCVILVYVVLVVRGVSVCMRSRRSFFCLAAAYAPCWACRRS